MVRQIVRNIAALFTGEVVARICHFISVVYIARLFGAAGFGAITFALAFISYFVMVTNLGLGEIGVREVSRKRDVGDIAGTILSMRLAIAGVSYLVIAGLTFFLKKSPETVWVVLAYGLTLFPYAFSLEWVFRGKERMKYNAYGRVLNALLYLGLILAFVRQPRDVILVALITLAADLVSSLFYYRTFVRKFGPVGLHVDLTRWISLARVSVPLFISTAMLGIYISFGTIALGFMKGERPVGIYSAASKLVFFVYAMSDLFVAAVFPVLSRLYHESRDRFDEFLRRCIKVTVTFGLPVAIGGMFLGGRIITLIYGDGYAESGGVFRILSWFAALNMTAFVVSYSLVSCDRQGSYLRVMAAGAGVNIVSNLALIPFIGYTAPAIALVAAETVVLVSAFAVLSRFTRLPPPGMYIRPLGAALVMAGSFHLLGARHLAIVASLGTAAYFGTLVAVGGITRGEFTRLREAFARR